MRVLDYDEFKKLLGASCTQPEHRNCWGCILNNYGRKGGAPYLHGCGAVWLHSIYAEIVKNGRLRLSYTDLNRLGFKIVGDKIVVRKGQLYTTEEDLREFPSKITLIPVVD